MNCIHQEKDLKISTFQRILILILGFTDNILFGGAVFGWPQLVYVLKVDGIFGDLCDEEVNAFEDAVSTNSNPNQNIIMGIDFSNNTNCLSSKQNLFGSDNTSDFNMPERTQCAAQDERFALVYTLAVVCYGIPGVLIGFLLHYVGLRITRILGGLMITLSFICLALATADSPIWLFPASVLLSVGGNQVRMSSMQFGDLFPRNRSTTITILTGVYAGSASLFVVFSIAQDYGIPRSSVCYFIAGFALVSTLFSFVLPPHHIPYEGETEDVEKLEKKEIISQVPLFESLKSASSLLHLYWFFILLFSINLYQQFYNVWITASTCNQQEESQYSMYFSYSNIISVFCAPLGGVLTDYLIRKARKNKQDELSFRTSEIQANFIPLFATTIFAMGLHGCMFFFNTNAIIVSLVCLIMVRPCVVAISTAYLRIRFPADHFNRLIGVYCTVSSALMYFQYPVFKWAQQSYYVAQGVTAAMILLSISNPLHLLLTWNIRQNVKQRDRLVVDYEKECLTKT